MTSTPDHSDIVALIDKSMSAGARQSAACAGPGLSERTLQRWMGGRRAWGRRRLPPLGRASRARKQIQRRRVRPHRGHLQRARICQPPAQPDRAAFGWPRHLKSLGIQLLQGVARARPKPPPRACAPGNQVGQPDRNHPPALRQKPLVRSGAGTSHGCRVRSPGHSSTSSSTSVVARLSAGRFTTARPPSSPPKSWNVRSGSRNASPARWHSTSTPIPNGGSPPLSGMQGHALPGNK